MDSKEKDDDLSVILNAAVRAPSGDNSQPWAFGTYEKKITVFYFPEKDNPILNYKNRGTLISVGAVIENIITQASDLGYSTKVKYLFNTSINELESRKAIAEIDIQSNGLDQKPLLSEYIYKRATNRKRYSTEFVNFDRRENYLSEVKCLLVTDNYLKKEVGRLLSVMEYVALRNKTLHRYFFKDIVWTQEEESSKKHGLYLKTLELPAPVRAIFRIIKHWQLMRIFNFFRFPSLASRANADVYGSSGAICLLSVENTDISFVKAGQKLQSIWLRAVRDGLSIQIVAGLVFLGEKLKKGEVVEDLSTKDRNQAIQSYENLLDIFKVVHPENTAALVFRIGKAPPPSAASSKKDPQIISLKT
jgi:hypothetical protein